MAKQITELLFENCINGNLKELKKFFGIPGCKLDIPLDENNNTALHIAASKNHIDIVRFFISKKANLEAENQWGQRPIDIAAENNNAELVHLLIENGAYPDGGHQEYYHAIKTPLIHAVEQVNIELAEYLLQNGANINALYDYFSTLDSDFPEGNLSALHLAAENGNLAMVKLLVKYGADVNSEDRMGNTPLHFSNSEIGAFLRKNGAEWQENVMGEPPIDSLSLAEIAEMIKSGNDFYENWRRDEELDWAIHYLVSSGDMKFVKEVIGNGADLSLRNSEGKTPAEIAILDFMPPNIELANFLVKHGSKCNSDLFKYAKLFLMPPKSFFEEKA